MKSELVVQLARAAIEGRLAAVQQTISQISDDEHAKGNDKLAQQFKILAKGSGKAIGPAFPQQQFRNAPPAPPPTWRNAKETNVWSVELPTERLADLVLAPAVETQLHRVVNDLLHEDRLRNWGVTEATRALFHGRPGTGKTMAARAVAGQASRGLIVVHLDQVMSSYLGETAKNVSEAFAQAAEHQAVIFLDEVDALAKSRDDGQDVGELKRTVNSILQILDRTRSTVPVLAATNHAGILDSAIWRRFSDVIMFELPTLEARQRLLTSLMKQVPIASPGQWSASSLAEVTEGFTGSDLRRLVMNATRTALHSGENGVNEGHLTTALREAVIMVHGKAIPLDRLQEIAKVAALSQKGLTYRKIAKEMGYKSTGTVAQRLGALRQDEHARLPAYRDSNDRSTGS